MKKIFALLLCAVLLCATLVFASAEGTEAATEVAAEASMTDTIVNYVKTHIEELSVIGTLLLTIFYEIRKHGKLNGSIGTLNNNAIAVAENSAASINTALAEVEGIAEVVRNYKDEFASVLEEIKRSAEEKKSIEETLAHVETFLKTAKLAIVEMSNEVAELLVLANIPNAKKEEFYARHTQALHQLEVAEKEVTDHEGEA